jgi:hypothetical protein
MKRFLVVVAAGLAGLALVSADAFSQHRPSGGSRPSGGGSRPPASSSRGSSSSANRGGSSAPSYRAPSGGRPSGGGASAGGRSAGAASRGGGLGNYRSSSGGGSRASSGGRSSAGRSGSLGSYRPSGSRSNGGGRSGSLGNFRSSGGRSNAGRSGSLGSFRSSGGSRSNGGRSGSLGHFRPAGGRTGAGLGTFRPSGAGRPGGSLGSFRPAGAAARPNSLGSFRPASAAAARPKGLGTFRLAGGSAETGTVRAAFQDRAVKGRGIDSSNQLDKVNVAGQNGVLGKIDSILPANAKPAAGPALIPFQKLPSVDPGPLNGKAATPAGPAVGDGSQGYDVVFTYKWGGEPGHHTFPTLEQAKAFAAEYSKGVYSTQDGTLTSINVVPLGNAGAKAPANTKSAGDTQRLTFDDNAPKGGLKAAANKNAAAPPAAAGKSAAPAAPQPAAAAQRAWSKNATRAAQNLAKDSDLAAALSQAAQGSKYFSAADLRTIVSIESSANRQTGKNQYGYAGLFQMGPAAAKEAGYKYKDLDEPSEWKTNVKAGVRYLEINAARLSKAGVEVTPLNVYLAHQQGATGATRVLAAVGDGTAGDTPANKNLLANLPGSFVKGITASGRQVTVRDYYDYWSAAFGTVNERVNPPSTPLP